MLALALALCASTAFAQDEIPGMDLNGGSYQENTYDDKPLLYEEGKPSPAKTTIIVRDTAYARPSAATPSRAKSNSVAPEVKKGNPNPEADPLNFNFLYYIIQKFKASDLMMEE